MKDYIFQNDWNEVKRFLPAGWMSQALKLNALQRRRGFSSPSALLRTLMIYLHNGASLKDTCALAKAEGIASISHIALSNRLKSSYDWLRWMTFALSKNSMAISEPPNWLKGRLVKAVDATVISESGSTGTDWRLHYSMNLFDLSADQYYLSDKYVGESLAKFEVNEGDVWIGDRAYCHLKEFQRVINAGADFIVRYKHKSFVVVENGQEVCLLSKLKKLKIGQIGDWTFDIKRKKDIQSLKVRVCALKKTKDQAEKAIKSYKRLASKRQTHVSTEVVELQEYVIIVTSIEQNISAENILELYRSRWQIEIAFKRMKSIMGLGQLPKKDPQACIAWLQGKIFIAALIERIANEGELFSPWGYPIRG